MFHKQFDMAINFLLNDAHEILSLTQLVLCLEFNFLSGLMIKSNLVTCRIIVKNTCSERITTAFTLHLGQIFKFPFSSRPFLQMDSNAESSVYTDESGSTLTEAE